VLDGYLAFYGLTAVPEGPDVVIENGTGPILRAHFDDRRPIPGRTLKKCNCC